MPGGRILDGTTQNCSGGGTPWGTWLSCEEVQGGLVCGPITHAELAEALAYDHPPMRFTIRGRELRALASGGAHYAGPAELDPEATYSVAASELFVARGRQVGTEVEALDWYLTGGRG